MTNGIVLIVGARDTNINERWRDNPQVVWISAEEAERKEVSANTKAVLFTRFVGHSVQHRILQQCRDKHVTFVPELLGTGEINKKLELFLGEHPTITEKPKKGFLKQFLIDNVDLTKDTKSETDRLLPILREKGIGTEASLSNEINKLKREHRITGVPNSIKSKNKILLETLDEAIAGLALVRETVQKMEAENLELTQKLSRLQEIIK